MKYLKKLALLFALVIFGSLVSAQTITCETSRTKLKEGINIIVPDTTINYTDYNNCAQPMEYTEHFGFTSNSTGMFRMLIAYPCGSNNPYTIIRRDYDWSIYTAQSCNHPFIARRCNYSIRIKPHKPRNTWLAVTGMWEHPSMTNNDWEAYWGKAISTPLPTFPGQKFDITFSNFYNFPDTVYIYIDIQTPGNPLKLSPPLSSMQDSSRSPIHGTQYINYLGQVIDPINYTGLIIKITTYEDGYQTTERYTKTMEIHEIPLQTKHN